ncbi:MAG: hypothetical protein JW913_08235 [Chitinispirillaceae bacterium]|nr:hypothetical protein [Chitinispirillaceae bacterium]
MSAGNNCVLRDDSSRLKSGGLFERITFQRAAVHQEFFFSFSPIFISQLYSLLVTTSSMRRSLSAL